MKLKEVQAQIYQLQQQEMMIVSQIATLKEIRDTNIITDKSKESEQ